MKVSDLNGYKKEALRFGLAMIFYFCFLTVLHFCVYGGFAWYGKSTTMLLCAALFALLCDFYENPRGFIICYLLCTCIVASCDVSALMQGPPPENFDMRGTAFYVMKYLSPFFIAWRACSFIKNLSVQRFLCIAVGVLFGQFIMDPLWLWFDIIMNCFFDSSFMLMRL